MTAWEIYWLLKLDDIQALFVVAEAFFVALCIAAGFFWMFVADESLGESDRRSKRVAVLVLKWAVPAAFVCLTTTTFIPSTAQMAAILVIPPVVNNERIQQIPEKVLDLVEKKLDELKGTAKE